MLWGDLEGKLAAERKSVRETIQAKLLEGDGEVKHSDIVPVLTYTAEQWGVVRDAAKAKVEEKRREKERAQRAGQAAAREDVD